MLLRASLVAELSSPVDNEVVVIKLVSTGFSPPSGVDMDLDRYFLSGDNRLAGNGKREKKTIIFKLCIYAKKSAIV